MKRKVKVACLIAGMEWHEVKTSAWQSDNPDPLHNDGDYWILVKGMVEHEGWESFHHFAYGQIWPAKVDEDFWCWLLLDPARFVSLLDLARFIDLIWDWTGREEVQEAYGMVECGCKGAFQGHCPLCMGSGKLPAPWLEERRKG